MTKTRFCRFPDLTLTGRSGTLWTKDHSRNTVSYLKGLRVQAFESLEAFKMYYAIGASVSSLHRESTDSLISFVVNITSIVNRCMDVHVIIHMKDIYTYIVVPNVCL